MSDELFDRSEFISYFKDESDELLQTIDVESLRLESFIGREDLDAEIVNAVFRALHTIKGSSGMLEFFDVQKVAHKLESAADLLRKGKIPLSEQFMDFLFAGRDLLDGLIRVAIEGGTPPSEFQEYCALIDEFTSAAARAAEEPAAPVPAASGADSAGAGAGDAFDPAQAAEMEKFEQDIWRAVEEQRRAAAAAAAPAPVPSLPGTAAPVAPPAAAAQPAAVAQPAAGPKPDTARKAAAANQTIRVDIQRLDTLLNLVGELVINRTRILDIAGSLARTVGNGAAENALELVGPLAKELADSSALLARTTNEIQESIMKVRMVPIGTVFDRFPRLVRDLAKQLGKEVDLQLVGADTELDKTIVDEIGDPLMHLVRNCLDHGVESPQARIAAGKPAAAVVKLNAFHEGNQIIIEISDDGAGIDTDRVREKAIRNGTLSETDKPTEQELVDMIFAPGFSTAEKVTDVSGRGVGMDVVRKNILKINGTFDVASVRGRGTTFTIRLPLTLAIIQALLVRISGELYSIPLDAVVESQRIDRADVRSVAGQEAITLRGSVVPLIRVSEYFELPGERSAEKLMVVIVAIGVRRVGLVVDSFDGEQEIVIKPLSEVVGAAAGISGATILGNGSISLIIDVHSLVAAAGSPHVAVGQHHNLVSA